MGPMQGAIRRDRAAVLGQGPFPAAVPFIAAGPLIARVPHIVAPLAAALCLAAWAAAPGAAAQTIEGRVLDEEREAPVPGALVALVDASGTARAEAISDGLGRYRLVPPQAGEYTIEVSALGYEPTRSLLLALGVEGSVGLDMLVGAAPVGLEGFEVSVEREAETFLGNFGLTPSHLANRWIDREAIDDMQMPGQVKDVIRWQNISGVYIDEYDATEVAPLCVRFVRPTRPCAITVLDGMVVAPETAFALQARDVEAVAILDPTDATTFYGTQAGGGAVLIWTRAGGR